MTLNTESGNRSRRCVRRRPRHFVCQACDKLMDPTWGHGGAWSFRLEHPMAPLGFVPIPWKRPALSISRRAPVTCRAPAIPRQALAAHRARERAHHPDRVALANLAEAVLPASAAVGPADAGRRESSRLEPRSPTNLTGFARVRVQRVAVRALPLSHRLLLRVAAPGQTSCGQTAPCRGRAAAPSSRDRLRP